MLEKIINSREDQIKYLAQMISDIKEKADEESFEKHIDLAILESNGILLEVRKTVSIYREHFGG